MDDLASVRARRRTDATQLDQSSRLRSAHGAPPSSVALTRPRPQHASTDGVDFAQAVVGNTRRYQALFCDAADECMPVPTEVHGDDDVFDVLLRQVRLVDSVVLCEEH